MLPGKKNWPRKKRMASWARQRQQITEAADGGARACTGADGAVVLNLRRGSGAFALLSRADGQPRAGQHDYSHLGLRPPSKDFDRAEGGRRAPANQAAQGSSATSSTSTWSTSGDHSGQEAQRAERRGGLQAQGLAAGTEQVAQREVKALEEPGGPTKVETLLRQRIRGLRSVSFQLPCEADRFEDKPLCVPRQLAELLQLSVEEVCRLRRHAAPRLEAPRHLRQGGARVLRV